MESIQPKLAISEIFTKGKTPDHNLDRVCATADFVAVFDGCTPKHEDKKAASEATSCLVDALVSGLTSLDAGSSWDEILSSLTKEASRFVTPYGASATGVIFSRKLMEILVIGDSWVRLDSNEEFFGHKFEGLLTEIRKAFTLQQLAQGSSVKDLQVLDPGRQAILPLLAREKEFRNIKEPGGYFFASLNGDEIPRELTVLIKVPTAAKTVTLASDGYPLLLESLAATEEFLLNDVVADPLRIGDYPGTKAVPPGGIAYDDRSYVTFSLHYV